MGTNMADWLHPTPWRLRLALNGYRTSNHDEEKDFWALVSLWETLKEVEEIVARRLLRLTQEDEDCEWWYRVRLCQWPGGCFRMVRRNEGVRLCKEHKSHFCEACGEDTHLPVGDVCSDCFTVKYHMQRTKEFKEVCAIPDQHKRREAWRALKKTFGGVHGYLRIEALTRYTLDGWQRLRAKIKASEKQRREAAAARKKAKGEKNERPDNNAGGAAVTDSSTEKTHDPN